MSEQAVQQNTDEQAQTEETQDEQANAPETPETTEDVQQAEEAQLRTELEGLSQDIVEAMKEQGLAQQGVLNSLMDTDSNEATRAQANRTLTEATTKVNTLMSRRASIVASLNKDEIAAHDEGILKSIYALAVTYRAQSIAAEPRTSITVDLTKLDAGLEESVYFARTVASKAAAKPAKKSGTTAGTTTNGGRRFRKGKSGDIPWLDGNIYRIDDDTMGHRATDGNVLMAMSKVVYGNETGHLYEIVDKYYEGYMARGDYAGAAQRMYNGEDYDNIVPDYPIVGKVESED